MRMLIVIFLKIKLFLEILVKWSISKCWLKTQFSHLEFDSFDFKVVFLAIVFISLHNAEEPCERREKKLQGSVEKRESSFQNTIDKAIVVN